MITTNKFILLLLICIASFAFVDSATTTTNEVETLKKNLQKVSAKRDEWRDNYLKLKTDLEQLKTEKANSESALMADLKLEQDKLVQLEQDKETD